MAFCSAACYYGTQGLKEDGQIFHHWPWMASVLMCSGLYLCCRLMHGDSKVCLVRIILNSTGDKTGRERRLSKSAQYSFWFFAFISSDFFVFSACKILSKWKYVQIHITKRTCLQISICYFCIQSWSKCYLAWWLVVALGCVSIIKSESLFFKS